MVSSKYNSLEEFLCDIPHNKDLKYIIEKMAIDKSFNWYGLDNLFERDSLGSSILNEIAFKRLDTMNFSASNLKVCYIFDEDFINNGSSILLFSLVGSDWNYVLRLENQLEFFNKRFNYD